MAPMHVLPAPQPVGPGTAHTTTPPLPVQVPRALQLTTVFAALAFVLAQQMSLPAQSVESRQQPEMVGQLPGCLHVAGSAS